MMGVAISAEYRRMLPTLARHEPRSRCLEEFVSGGLECGNSRPASRSRDCLRRAAVQARAKLVNRRFCRARGIDILTHIKVRGEIEQTISRSTNARWSSRSAMDHGDARN